MGPRFSEKDMGLQEPGQSHSPRNEEPGPAGFAGRFPSGMLGGLSLCGTSAALGRWWCRVDPQLGYFVDSIVI